MPGTDVPAPIAEQTLSAFDLAKLRAPQLDVSDAIGTKPCSVHATNEIVVCASAQHNRLRPLNEVFAATPEPLRAGAALSDRSRLDVHGQAVTLAGGAQSNRMMVTYSLGF